MRFWLCYVISLGVFVFGVYLSGVDSIFNFIDVPTFILVPLLPFIMQSILSGSIGKNLKAVFSKKTDEEEARRALTWIQGFNRLVWCSAALFFFVEFFYTVVRELTNRGIGVPNFAVALIAPIYALLTTLSFTLPVMILLKNKLGKHHE